MPLGEGIATMYEFAAATESLVMRHGKPRTEPTQGEANPNEKTWTW